MAIFPTFFFREYRPGKCLLRYFRTKKRPSRLEKQEVQKVEKLTFFPYIGVNRSFWSKNGHFSNFLFLGNIGQVNFFYDILEPKNAFLGFKNKNFKKSKNWYFSNGVNPSFWSKNGHFSNFLFLGNIGQENVFYDILEPENTFLGYKNEKLKKLKNWHFFKGLTHALGPKMAVFRPFFLGNIGQENVFHDILEPKNALRGYKNKKFKKSKNWCFPYGVIPWFLLENGHFSNFFLKAI